MVRPRVCDVEHTTRREFIRCLGRAASVAVALAALPRHEASAAGTNPEVFYDSYLSIFFDGGPSQTDTWDVKPGSSSSYPNFPTIDLGVSDVYGERLRIAGVFPRLAGLVMNDPAIKLGVVRSVHHASTDHGTAQHCMRSWLHDGRIASNWSVSGEEVAFRMTAALNLILAGASMAAIDIAGNDTHTDNMATVRRIWGNYVNEGLSELATNIKASGKRVLVTMYGDFGRTPRSVNNGARDGRDHWGDGFSVAMLSINQPKFKMNAIGDTGPDGTLMSTSGMRDPIEPKDLGGFVYRSLGFQVGRVDGKFDIPLTSRPAPPVDRINKADLLNTTFGLV